MGFQKSAIVLPLLLVVPCYADEAGAPSTVEQNKLTTRKVIAMFNNRDYSVVDTLFTKDHLNHAIQTVNDPPKGRDGIKSVIGRIESAFPDFKMEMLDLIAEGDRVAYRTRFTGTHRGSYMGIPPTGRKVSFEAMHFLRFLEGKVAEHWSVRDDLTRLGQLGQSPASASTKNQMCLSRETP